MRKHYFRHDIKSLQKENVILNRIIKLMLDDFCLDRPLKGYDPAKGQEIYETNDEIIAGYRSEAEKEEKE